MQTTLMSLYKGNNTLTSNAVQDQDPAAAAVRQIAATALGLFQEAGA